MQNHDLGNGWFLIENDDGSMTIGCNSPSAGTGTHLNPAEAKRLREIVRDDDEPDGDDYAQRAEWKARI